MEKLKINDVTIAAMPTEFTCTIQDLDYNGSSEFGRSIDGTLNRNRIATKRTLVFKYNPITWEVLSDLLQQMADEFFTVYYPDSYTGVYETKTFYVSDRSAGVLKTSLNVNDEIYWQGVGFTLVEQ